MKIKCEYCDSMYDDTLESCPNCAAPNKNVRRSTPDQPTTIAELEQWYRDRGLPPYGVTRFYINVDYRNPKAFGIYQDERTGNYVVYKNKADGTRAIRYEGTDEAFAVNELLTRLKQEILEQKSNSLKKNGTVNSYSSPPRRRKKRGSGLMAFIITLLCMGFPLGAMFWMMRMEAPSPKGYYVCNDQEYYEGMLFYHYGDDQYGWAVWDSEETGDWKKTSVYPGAKFERAHNSKDYFLSSDYSSSYASEYGAYNFQDSIIYDDYLHGFIVAQGYYSYDDDIYYHMKPDEEHGWYVFNEDDNDWHEVFFLDVPSDLKHQSVAQDFWYTPTWDSETQMTDFETTDEYIEYQEYLEESARQASESSDSSSSSDYDWDSGSDSWDSGSTDWDSDW